MQAQTNKTAAKSDANDSNQSSQGLTNLANLKNLAFLVNTLARTIPLHKRVGVQKVYLSDLYEATDSSMFLNKASFRAALSQMHRAGFICLSRCDLPGAFDAKRLDRSQLMHQVGMNNQTEYHFLRIP
jgi:hypothetical protein